MGSACCGSETTVITPVRKTDPPPIRHKSSIKRESSAILRITNVDITKKNRLKLIDGYLNEPLVSLEEALKPFDSKIDQLSHYIQEAKANCYYPNAHNLTRDESAAIYIYTTKWPEGSVYDHLQAAWKSEDPYKLKPWFKYLKLFRTALDKLPSEKSEIWQGAAFSEGLKDKLNSKSTTPIYSTLCSFSPSPNRIKDYLRKHYGTKTILIGYECVDGKVLTDYTAGGSKEVLIYPGVKLGVAKYLLVDVNGSVIVHMMGESDRHPEQIEVNISPSGKHFACPRNGCGNRCPDDHDPHHCHGFASLSHVCQHHCDPEYTCNKCTKHVHNLRECYNCHRRYCDKCCFE